MLPLFLDLTGRLCLVVGGGAVGRRKALKLLEAGALVRLVCLEPTPAERQHPALEWVQQAYEVRHLEGAALVVAAATPAVNQQVVRDARGSKVWVNNVSDPADGDCHFPATVQRGAVQLAISTGGRAPAVALRLSQLLDDWLDQAVADLVALVAEFRPLLLELPRPLAQNCLDSLSDPVWLDRLRQKGVDWVRAEMQRTITQMVTRSAR